MATAQEVAILLKAKGGDDAAAQIGKVSTATKSLSKEMDSTRLVGTAFSNTFQAIAKDVAIGFAAMGAAVGAGLIASTKSAMDFEHTMSGVKAVSGATGEQMQDLSALALQLGKDTVFSAGEAGKALEELVKGGVEIPDIMNGAAAATLNLASAGGVDLTRAAEIAANAMNQFRLKGSDMAHVADQVAGAANASSLDVNDFALSLQQVGAVAHTAGQSFDSTALSIAIMGAAGIKGSDAGTSLKTMLMNLQPQTNRQKDAMRELGIITATGANQFVDATGKFKNMRDIAEILNQSTKNLTESQKLQYLETIFGSDAVRAAAIVSEAGAAGFDKMADSMGKVTAAGVAAERLNNLTGDLEQLKGSVDTAAIMLGETFQPALRELAQAANEHMGVVIDRMGEVQLSAKNLATENGLSDFDATVVATSQVIEREFGVSAAKAFETVVTGFTNLAATIQEYGPPTLQMLGDIAHLFGMVGEAVAPIVNVVGPQLRNLFDTWGQGLDALMGIIYNTIVAIVNLKNGIGEFFDALGTKVDAALREIGTFMVNLAPTLTTGAVQLGASIINGIVEGLNPAAVTEKLKNLAGDALQAAKDRIEAHSPSQLFAREVGLPMALGIVAGLDQGTTQVVTAAESLVMRGFRGAVDKLGTVGPGEGSYFTGGIRGADTGAGTAATGKTPRTALEGLHRGVADLIISGQLREQLGNLALDAWGDFTEAFNTGAYGAGSKAGNAIQRVIDAARKVGVPNWEALGAELLAAAESGLTDHTEESKGRVLTAFETIYQAVQAQAKDAADKVAKAFDPSQSLHEFTMQVVAAFQSDKTKVANAVSEYVIQYTVGNKSGAQSALSSAESFSRTWLQRMTEKLSPEDATALISRYMAAFSFAITDRSTEALAALQSLIDEMEARMAASVNNVVAAATNAYGGSAGGSGPGTAHTPLIMPSLGIKAMATGGMVTSPTLALIGEHGPEAVMPLNQAGGMTVNVTVNGSVTIPDLDTHIRNVVIDANRSGRVLAR